MIGTQHLLVVLIFFITGIIAELSGFGISAFSMSLLPLFLPLTTAVPLVAVISVIATGLVAFRLKEKNILKYLRLLFIGSLLGVPAGLAFLRFSTENILEIFLGCLLIVSATYSLLVDHNKSVINKIPSFLVGLVAGFFGAAINVNGPLIGVYISSEQFDKYKNKDLITTYMFFTGLAIVAGHIFLGNIKLKTLSYLILAIPALLGGLITGSKIFEKINTNLIEKIIYLFVLAAGIKLLF